MTPINYNGTQFHSSAYILIVYYPNFIPKNSNLPRSIINWQIILDNCTYTRTFSILNRKKKSIKYIIDDWSQVCKFSKKIESLFPDTRIDIYNKIIPKYTFKKIL
jgi:hypothetical protein